ncbi:MAG: hypothetical protein JO168_01780 [Solirubrobacterales bacterium]|nr:hypothetical protein [Solirubrobacterales bacterium]
MTSNRRSLAKRAFDSAKELWSEFDYAQRRTLEIQLGRSFLPSERRDADTDVAELEALYALECDEESHFRPAWPPAA